MNTASPATNGQKRAHAADVLRQVVPISNFSDLNGRLPDLLLAAVYFCDHEDVVVRRNQRAAGLWGRQPTAGYRTDRFCGCYKHYRTDGTFRAHGDCPMTEPLRTGQPQRNVEAVIERPDLYWPQIDS